MILFREKFEYIFFRSTVKNRGITISYVIFKYTLNIMKFIRIKN